ncbi:MAG TPA: hypothetical protein VFH54_09270 [Mycobacteriales bacterium]|jgi:hypothetical protein|nr:hypothetical protein [Mycobacteriales bacterium]HET7407561.1 hypothetical protein [Mycobacteriales bacterium]
MTDLQRDVCDRCGRPVLLGRTDTRRWTVVDPEPGSNPWYAYTLIWRDGQPRLHLLSLADILRADSLEIRPRLYAPHILRCAPQPARSMMAGSR